MVKHKETSRQSSKREEFVSQLDSFCQKSGGEIADIATFRSDLQKLQLLGTYCFYPAIFPLLRQAIESYPQLSKYLSSLSGELSGRSGLHDLGLINCILHEEGVVKYASPVLAVPDGQHQSLREKFGSEAIRQSSLTLLQSTNTGIALSVFENLLDYFADIGIESSVLAYAALCDRLSRDAKFYSNDRKEGAEFRRDSLQRLCDFLGLYARKILQIGNNDPELATTLYDLTEIYCVGEDESGLKRTAFLRQNICLLQDVSDEKASQLLSIMYNHYLVLQRNGTDVVPNGSLNQAILQRNGIMNVRTYGDISRKAAEYFEVGNHSNVAILFDRN